MNPISIIVVGAGVRSVYKPDEALETANSISNGSMRGLLNLGTIPYSSDSEAAS